MVVYYELPQCAECAYPDLMVARDPRLRATALWLQMLTYSCPVCGCIDINIFNVPFTLEEVCDDD